MGRRECRGSRWPQGGPFSAVPGVANMAHAAAAPQAAATRPAGTPVRGTATNTKTDLITTTPAAPWGSPDVADFGASQRPLQLEACKLLHC